MQKPYDRIILRALSACNAQVFIVVAGGIDVCEIGPLEFGNG